MVLDYRFKSSTPFWDSQRYDELLTRLINCWPTAGTSCTVRVQRQPRARNSATWNRSDGTRLD